MKRQLKKITTADHDQHTVARFTVAELKQIYNSLLIDQLTNAAQSDLIEQVLDWIEQVLD